MISQNKSQTIQLEQFDTISSERSLTIYDIPKTENVSKQVIQKLLFASLVGFIFLIAEVIGGLMANSLAILSEVKQFIINLFFQAAHMFSDLSGFSISIFSVWLATKPSSQSMSYGYHRAEVIGALLSIFLIWTLTLLLLYESTCRIIYKEAVKKPQIMLLTAGFGLFCNIVMAKVLHSTPVGHSHSHAGCSHHHVKKTYIELESQAEVQNLNKNVINDVKQKEFDGKNDQNLKKNHLDNKQNEINSQQMNEELQKDNQIEKNDHHKPENNDDQDLEHNNHCNHNQDHHDDKHEHHNHNLEHNDDHKHKHKYVNKHENLDQKHEHHDPKDENHDHTHDRHVHKHNHLDHKNDHHDHNHQHHCDKHEQECNHQHEHHNNKYENHNHKHQHEHHHDHNQESIKKNLSVINQKDNYNLRSAMIHVIGDIIQSIGVLIAALLIYILGGVDDNNSDIQWNAWHLADPICTYLFSILVIITTINVTKDCFKVLMESVPKNFESKKFLELMQNIQYVHEVHDLHVWSLSIGKPSMSIHIIVDEQQNHQHVLVESTKICRKFGIYHSTIQIESKDDIGDSNYIKCLQNIHN